VRSDKNCADSAEIDMAVMTAAGTTEWKTVLEGFCIARDTRETVGYKSISGAIRTKAITAITTNATTLAQQLTAT
jgi:hypothetical protein